MDRQVREKAANELLSRVGLAGRLSHYPGQMSGGQQQERRVFGGRPRIKGIDGCCCIPGIRQDTQEVDE